MKTTKTLLLLISVSIFAIFQLHAQTPGFEWAGQVGGDSLLQATSCAVDLAGNQIIIGAFKNTADFNPDPSSTCSLTAVGGDDIFIQKLDPDGNLLWASSMGDTMNDRGFEVVTDAAGNIYATGYFWGTIDADPGEGEFPLSQNRYTAMVLKIDPNGNLIWGKQMGSETAGHAYGWSIAVDNNGNVITSGYFNGRVDFDPGPGIFNLTCTSNDMFIQKLDANGNFIWVNQIIGTQFKVAYSLTTDAGGNIYAGGYFRGTVDFNPDKKLKYNLTSFGDYDAFILKMTGNGTLSWARQIGGTQQDLCYSIALDPTGYLYATGQFYGTSDFNPGTGTYNMTAFGGNDAYVLKIDLSGNFVWAKQFGGPSFDSAGDIILDNLGNFYISGYFYTTTDFDPGSGTYYLTANGHNDSFVCKADQEGSFLWVIQAGGAGWDYSMSLDVDAAGNIINVGSFEQTTDFDPGGNSEYELTNVAIRDMFVQKLNPDGGDNCLVPIGLIASNITQNSADLTWAAVAGAGGYYVRYREPEAEWNYSVLITGLTHSISGLTAITAYEFQVKTDCESNFSYSHSFITLGEGCPDNYEPNESMAAAPTIPVNTDITALVGSSSDLDFFKFTTTVAAKNIHITLTSLPANYNMNLYKSDGSLLSSSLNPGTEDESIIYNSNKAATYYVRVYGFGGAFDPADCYVLHVAASSTGYKSDEADIKLFQEHNGLILYPNPARDVLNLDYNSKAAGTVTCALISISGQVILEQEFSAGEGQNHNTLNLEGIANGLYMIKLTRNGESTLSNFMVNR